MGLDLESKLFAYLHYTPHEFHFYYLQVRYNFQALLSSFLHMPKINRELALTHIHLEMKASNLP